ncbi:hypothetical protein TYRP_005793 [Tyrophagus putrescentiae]|nr:hypothetical protein TYRP_005793 [Tyrophagus putrescentiae]
MITQIGESGIQQSIRAVQRTTEVAEGEEEELVEDVVQRLAALQALLGGGQLPAKLQTEGGQLLGEGQLVGKSRSHRGKDLGKRKKKMSFRSRQKEIEGGLPAAADEEEEVGGGGEGPAAAEDAK